MSGALRVQLAVTSGADQAGEPPRFMRCSTPSFRCEREAFAPRIAGIWSVGRLDQLFVRMTPQRLIEGAGARVESAAGLRFDMLADGIAVRRAITKGQQNVECEV